MSAVPSRRGGRLAAAARKLLLFLLLLATACGSGPGPTASGTPAADPPTGSPAPGDGPSPAPVIGGRPAPLGLPIGTEPPLVGAFHSVDAFPLDQLVSVVPRDAIPALTDPEMADASGVPYLADDDLVLGVEVGGEARAYPHNIGWWHEIVNDVVGGHPLSVTFCPLTGTGLVFDGTDGDARRLLGVSGMLYNTNLVIYDRGDGGTLYPQIYGAAVRGPDAGAPLRLLPVVETTWRTWKRLHPDTRVVAGGTYAQSQYTRYPYGDYRTDDRRFLFAVEPRLSDNPNPHAGGIRAKDRVLGLRVDGRTRAYPAVRLGERRVLNDTVGELELLVVHDEDASLTVPYSRRVGERLLTFEVADVGAYPFALRDRETGTTWDVLGHGVEGPLAGERLTPVPAHMSMWFAWVTFWPGTEVWEPGS